MDLFIKFSDYFMEKVGAIPQSLLEEVAGKLENVKTPPPGKEVMAKKKDGNRVVEVEVEHKDTDKKESSLSAKLDAILQKTGAKQNGPAVASTTSQQRGAKPINFKVQTKTPLNSKEGVK